MVEGVTVVTAGVTAICGDDGGMLQVVVSSGKTDSAIYHYRSLYITICDLCCNKCNNSIMASIALPPYL